MTTTNLNFKVKNGLDAGGDISTTASLYANKTSFASNIVSSAPGSVTFWKIATLPTSSAGTYDHLVIDAVLDDNWGSDQKVNTRILFSNRNAFTYRYYLNGNVRSAARILAYTEADGSVSIYLRAGSGNFCSFSYNITHGLDNGTTVIKNPASTTTTPSGTLVFDSSNVSTYVPESYIPYSGQPVIRGLVNGSGTVSGVSFVKSGGTSAQFLKADGSVDSNTYLPTTSSYFAGHNPEGRLMYNTYLTNDMANARLRGSAVAATQNGSPYTISNANWDAMFDGTATFFNISPTSGFTFPLVITVPLPRTLTYGTWVGLSFGSTTFRANSVTIEVFSLDSNSWVTVFTTTTNTSEDIFTSVSGLTNSNATGINQVRYTIAAPNSTQLRLQHLWAYNFNSDMWSQTMMPRAGGAFYGAISVPGSVTMTGALNVNTTGTGTLNLGDAQISKAPGSGFSFSSGIGSLTSLGIGTSANNASPLSVFFDTPGKFNILRGAANQLADLLEFQTSSGTILGGRNANAQIYSGSTDSITTSTGGATTATSGTGTVATITTTSVHSLSTGDRVTVAGVTPTGYNGTYIVTGTPTTTSFTYANTTTGAQTVSGTVRVDAQASITSRSAATVGLLVRGAASQASNIFEAQNSSGTVLASVAANGTFLINGIGVTAGDHRVGTNNYYTAALNVFARSVTEKGIALRANNTGQNANMIEVQSSAGTVLSGTSPNGQLFTGTTEPIRLFTGGATTAASGTGSVATITTTSVHNLSTGDRVTVAGVTPTGYNGTFIVASTPTTSSFTYANATTGSQTVAGTVAVDAQASIVSRSAATTPLILRAAVNQSVNMLRIEGSGGGATATIDAAGAASFVSGGVVITGGSSVSVNGTLNTATNLRVGDVNATISGNKIIYLSNATVPSVAAIGGGFLFTNSGALQYRGTSGGNTTIVNADGTTPYVAANNGLLTSVSTIGGGGSEGGQINFARVTDGAQYWYIDSFGSTASPDLRFVENTTERFKFLAGGAFSVNGQAGTAGQVLTSQGSSTAPTWTNGPVDGTTTTAASGIGFMGMPQNATTTGAYTVVAADAGKHIYASATRTVTINSNANLALPIGTTLTFIAGTGATMTIAITSDTLILAGPGTTGSRTLAPFGMATAVKITSTSWIISGNGLT